MKRTLLAGLAVFALGIALAWGANNFRQSTSGGTVTTFKSTDNAGVHTPHINVDTIPTASSPTSLSISQVSIATTDTLAIAARVGRAAVTVQQITGTQNVFCNQTTATAANGVVLPPIVGASFTFNTASAIRCIAITGAQTVAIAETF